MAQGHHIDEKLVTIAEYTDGFEAELAHVTLENAGIDSVVLGGDLVANMPTINIIKVQLQVFENDVERAKFTLKEQAEQFDQAEGQ